MLTLAKNFVVSHAPVILAAELAVIFAICIGIGKQKFDEKLNESKTLGCQDAFVQEFPYDWYPPRRAHHQDICLQWCKLLFDQDDDCWNDKTPRDLLKLPDSFAWGTLEDDSGTLTEKLATFETFRCGLEDCDKCRWDRNFYHTLLVNMSWFAHEVAEEGIICPFSLYVNVRGCVAIPFAACVSLVPFLRPGPETRAQLLNYEFLMARLGVYVTRDKLVSQENTNHALSCFLFRTDDKWSLRVCDANFMALNERYHTDDKLSIVAELLELHLELKISEKQWSPQCASIHVNMRCFCGGICYREACVNLLAAALLVTEPRAQTGKEVMTRFEIAMARLKNPVCVEGQDGSFRCLKNGTSTEVFFTVVHSRKRVSTDDVADVREELRENGFEVGPMDP